MWVDKCILQKVTSVLHAILWEILGLILGIAKFPKRVHKGWFTVINVSWWDKIVWVDTFNPINPISNKSKLL